MTLKKLWRTEFAVPGERLFIDSHLHMRNETKFVFFSESKGRNLNFNKKRHMNIVITELLYLLQATINMIISK